MNIMLKSKILVIVVLAIFAFQSCEKDPLTQPAATNAPSLPPIESFYLSLDSWAEIDTTGFNEDLGKSNGPTYTNVWYAATNMVVWNGFIIAASAIPVATFAEAFNHEAVYNPTDDTFEWNYTHREGLRNFRAKLVGEILSNEEVSWKMFISLVGQYEDALFYEGITSRDNIDANWTLYGDPVDPKPTLFIEYSKNDNGESQIKYTNILEATPEFGHFIESRNTNGTDYNRFFDVYRGKDDFLQIKLIEPGKGGAVKNVKFFGDDEYHCWDDSYQDTEC